MRRTFVASLTAAAVLVSVATSAAAPPEGRGSPRPAGPVSISLDPLGTYASDVLGASAAEIVAHDPETQRLFVVNAQAGVLDVLDISDPGTPEKINEINALDVDLIATEAGGDVAINSVAVRQGIVAAAVEAPIKTDDGWAAFFDTDGNPLGAVGVGALPDMITFSPDGNWVLVANEGEPRVDEESVLTDAIYADDPAGSISVIDVRDGVDAATVATAGFEAWDSGSRTLDPAVRIFGPEDLDGDPDTAPLPSENLEPEYIVVDDDSRTAYVVLQENNAMAVIDIASASVTDIWPLGFKDHSLPGNGLDASDRDGAINIARWPVLGMYQPDGFDAYRFRGETYLVTANEGDAREWLVEIDGDDVGYSEESRFRAHAAGRDLCDGGPVDTWLKANSLTLAQLRDNANLGRLTITTTLGLGAGGCLDEIYVFGGRSFSIWSTDGQRVYDSGDEFEQITAERIPEDFNANNRANDTFDSRSDNKGPEPESVAIGTVNGRTYAFIVLERVGGIMVYDISDPRAAFFVDYVTTRDFTAEDAVDAGDLGPEGIIFIEADGSPTGRPMLAVGNEVSGTTTLFDISLVTPTGAGRDPRP